MCACSLENAVVFGSYGWYVYSLHMWIVGCYLSSVLEDLQTSNVCTTVYAYLTSRTGLRRLMLICFIQLLAGLGSFYLAYTIWSLRLTTAHERRLSSFDNGCANFLPISVYSAALVEYLGTIADRGLPLFLLTSRKIELKTWTYVLWNVIITITGVKATGMFANPVNASNQMFGCSGLTKSEHIFIYWVSPLAATITLYLIFRRHVVKTVKSE
ncbi:DgyrCDS3766 [Dimorphilus gyrociliatus]|uniref:DgyrCDS3766 n=1 Tax=Dimorphilus gyrociliatus TaxID=2664684 RepID=A0A7I8VGE6_9ANNE|nr:DgyrCDS3766 [Dimorphilus gyrociliatus]